ncbi:MAG: carboxypeptidase-like regulatory domain-containing protein, partial [Ignavibacteriae bacterium]|nr:carboxypeptidase-like regulatory domain-containing protein [Ignavibacteriota bacterium]
MKLFQISAIIVFISINTIIAQNILSGKVFDRELNEPLVGVEVFIKNLNVGTTTNANGFFEIKNLKNNSYDVRFSYLGYATITKTMVVPSQEAENILINLEETSIDLQEVMVTGNPFLSETKDLSQTAISLSSLDLIIKSGSS